MVPGAVNSAVVVGEGLGRVEVPTSEAPEQEAKATRHANATYLSTRAAYRRVWAVPRTATVPSTMRGPIPLEEIEAARSRIYDHVVRTPLLRLEAETAQEIYLKLENLQPIGAFKLRGAMNAIARIDPRELTQGLWTVSAGNMAQGVAYGARRLGVPCTAVVPDVTPAAKRLAIERLGGRIIETDVPTWYEVFETCTFPGLTGRFIHPFSDPDVIAGNGTIGLEILEDLPDLDAVIVPFGGGGLSAGVGSAIRAVRPAANTYAAEFVEMAPLAASWRQGAPVTVPFVPTFIDGIGGPTVLPEILELAKQVLAGVLTVTVEETAAAIRLIAERGHVIAEGAGAVSLAAALNGDVPGQRIVCVVSGGNIDTEKLATIMRGEVP